MHGFVGVWLRRPPCPGHSRRFPAPFQCGGKALRASPTFSSARRRWRPSGARIFGESAHVIADCLCLFVHIFCVSVCLRFSTVNLSRRRDGPLPASWPPSNRVSPAKRVGHGFFGQRIGHPLAVHDEAVFVGAGAKAVPSTSCRNRWNAGSWLQAATG